MKFGEIFTTFPKFLYRLVSKKLITSRCFIVATKSFETDSANAESFFKASKNELCGVLRIELTTVAKTSPILAPLPPW